MRIAQFITLAAILGVLGYLLFKPRETPQRAPQPQTTASIPTQITVEHPDVETAIQKPEPLPMGNPYADPVPLQQPPELIDTPLGEVVRQLPDLGWTSRGEHFRESFVPQITLKNWKEACDAITQFPLGSNGAIAVRTWRPKALNIIGELNGREACNYLLSLNKLADLEPCLKGWLLSEPQEALDWLQVFTTPITRSQMWNTHGVGIMSNEKSLAGKMAKNFFTQLLDNHDVEMSEKVFQQIVIDLRAGIDKGNACLPEMFSLLASATLAQKMAETNGRVETTAEWLSLHLTQSYADPELVNLVLVPLIQQNGGEAALKWLDDCQRGGTEMNPAVYSQLFTEWAAGDGSEAIAKWLAENPTHHRHEFLSTLHAALFEAEKQGASLTPLDEALFLACHGLPLPASATKIQHSGDATEDKPDKGLVTLFEVNTDDMLKFINGLQVLADQRPLKETGDPTVNGWNVWPTTAKTFVPGNAQYANLKKNWIGEATPALMFSCESSVGDWLHVELWNLPGKKRLLKVYTDWN